MRKHLIALTLGALALGFACGAHAKTAVHYAADQAVCPTQAQAEEEPEAQAAPGPAASPASRAATPEPVKSNKSSRGKWKALLPGTIR